MLFLTIFFSTVLKAVDTSDPLRPSSSPFSETNSFMRFFLISAILSVLFCLSASLYAADRSLLTTELTLSSTLDISSFSNSLGSLAAFSAKLIIASMTCPKLSCPNVTAPNITSSDNSFASDSTIKTASFVPATTRSRSESSISDLLGFNMYSPSLNPTLAAPIGPIKGTPDRVNAAEHAIIATISGSFSVS